MAKGKTKSQKQQKGAAYAAGIAVNITGIPPNPIKCPFTVSGTVNPGAALMSSWIVDGGGGTYDGELTKAPSAADNTWQFVFGDRNSPPVPPPDPYLLTVQGTITPQKGSQTQAITIQ